MGEGYIGWLDPAQAAWRPGVPRPEKANLLSDYMNERSRKEQEETAEKERLELEQKIPLQLAEYAAEAERKGILAEEGAIFKEGPDGKAEILVGPMGEWFVCDGVEMNPNRIIDDPDSRSSVVPTWKIMMHVGKKMPGGRIDEVGTYNYSNGVIGHVDSQGRIRVAPLTPARLAALIGRRYKLNSEFYVTFSEGETAVDPDAQKRWNELYEQAEQENASFIS